MGLGWTELLILAGVLILLFGSARLPSLMRSMGRSITEFKAGMSDKPAEVDRVEDKSRSKDSEKENDVETVNH
jgi:sec-independent protein translocase protein TatA